MGINNSQRAEFAPELLATMTGAAVLIGTLEFNPVIIIFDNQGGASVAISVDGGTSTWKTFPAGEALVLDLRAAHGLAPNYTFDIGTSFYGTGASGDFSISYIYAKNT
ncbi:MAG TPA: hypothetical protein VKE92_13080 [Anaerolineales bacterium]|nr:hypothetical protein [Anaerolineales bacterium]